MAKPPRTDSTEHELYEIIRSRTARLVALHVRRHQRLVALNLAADIYSAVFELRRRGTQLSLVGEVAVDRGHGSDSK